MLNQPPKLILPQLDEPFGKSQLRAKSRELFPNLLLVGGGDL